VTPLVTANPAQLSQAFFSLIQNACQAITARDEPGFHGRLRLATRLQEDLVLVEVADNAGGIPVDLVPRIFEPFFTTRADTQSSGLGLTVAASIIADHGGRIELDNRIGAGCCFRVLLPV
jgi:signal transduction histidine kinase